MNVHIKSILSALAFSFLFYSKSFGLNLILISILVVVLVSSLKKEAKTPWLYATVYIFTGIFVFLNPSGFTIFVYLMAFLVFVGKSISEKTSLYISWLAGAMNMLIASVAHLNNWQNSPNEEKKGLSDKTLNYVKGSLLALTLLVIFSALYKSANPVFGGLIDQINLDFISMPWVFFTVLGYLIFLHLLRPLDPKELIAFDKAQTDTLEEPTELVLIGAKKSLETEQILGSMIFLTLNMLLIFYLTTDVIYLFHDRDISNAGFSQSVHQGVYALMFSIICAIALILYFFRGNLNFFQNNRKIKSLTYLWIGLNVILVAFTCYKNYAYVEALGLTYKRIGVFVYLLLTLTGLITAYIKVSQIKSFTYLVRTNIATLFFFLVLSAVIPWNKTITWYNLKNIENPDMKYLIHLGDTNSDQLYEFAKVDKNQLSLDIKKSIYEKHETFLTAQSEKTWQEYNLYNLTQYSSK